MKLKHLLFVPTDFSDVCHNAIDYAAQIAVATEFKVMIYHVINKDSYDVVIGDEDVGIAVSNKLNSIAEEFKMKYSNLDIDFTYEGGSIFDLIHKKAEEVGANMIILGTHGKKGLQKLFGSYALRVITRAKVPTVVVQNKPFKGIQKVLFPVNSFTEARQKVNYAKAFAERFNSEFIIYKEEVSDPGESSRIQIISKQIIEEFKKEGISYSVNNSGHSGESAKLITRFAVQESVDLIMVVTETKIGATHFNPGPWNEKIMFNEAQIPVMCINPVQHGKIYFDI